MCVWTWHNSHLPMIYLHEKIRISENPFYFEVYIYLLCWSSQKGHQQLFDRCSKTSKVEREVTTTFFLQPHSEDINI